MREHCIPLHLRSRSTSSAVASVKNTGMTSQSRFSMHTWAHALATVVGAAHASSASVSCPAGASPEKAVKCVVAASHSLPAAATEGMLAAATVLAVVLGAHVSIPLAIILSLMCAVAEICVSACAPAITVRDDCPACADASTAKHISSAELGCVTDSSSAVTVQRMAMTTVPAQAATDDSHLSRVQRALTVVYQRLGMQLVPAQQAAALMASSGTPALITAQLRMGHASCTCASSSSTPTLLAYRVPVSFIGGALLPAFACLAAAAFSSSRILILFCVCAMMSLPMLATTVYTFVAHERLRPLAALRAAVPVVARALCATGSAYACGALLRLIVLSVSYLSQAAGVQPLQPC